MKRNHAQVWVHQLSESSINKIWCSFHLSELLSFPLDRSASILPPSRLLGGITHWTVEKRKQRDCSLWGGPQVTHRLCLVSGLNCHSITGGTWVFSEIVPAPLTVRELLLKEKQWEFSLRGRGGTWQNNKLTSILEDLEKPQSFPFRCRHEQLRSLYFAAFIL